MRVSVCMATYNGEKYVGEQVDSILRQLRATDELIVVDDGSSDATINRVLSFGDDRIRLLDRQANVGPVQAFGRAIAHAKGDVIFMADQDDIWLDGRLSLFLEAFAITPALVVSANSTYIDGVGRPIDRDAPALRGCDSSKWLRNIAGIMSGRTGYYGCAMAFRAEMRDLLVPFPLYVESHDLWIALAANLLRRNLHLEVPTLARRIHGGNASIVSRPVGAKIWSRVVFVISLMHIAWRRFVRRK
jgi:glycosyltransferase involved in cell wall biosynthesis